MARGFESKSVAEQQEENARSRHDKPVVEDNRPSPKKRSLELARVDLANRIKLAPEPHRPRLEKALEEIDKQISEA